MGGHIEVCKFIIETFSKKNPSIDFPITYPLHCAARYGHLEVYKLLIENKSDKNPQCHSGWTPLHQAASGGHLNNDITEVAMQHHLNMGVNINVVNGALPIDITANYGHLEICKFLMMNIADKNPSNNTNGATALHVAAWSGQLEVYKLVMQSVVDKNPMNRFGQTPLHLAANAGQLEICRLIIDSVEDKNPGHRWTPLHEAVYNGHLQVCKLIVENIHEVIDKDRLISWALLNGHIEVCEFLINGEKDCETNFNPISRVLFIFLLTILFGAPPSSGKWIFYIIAAKCLNLLVFLGPVFYLAMFTVLNDPPSFGYSLYGILAILALYFPFLGYVFDPMLESYLRYKWKI